MPFKFHPSSLRRRFALAWPLVFLVPALSAVGAENADTGTAVLPEVRVNAEQEREGSAEGGYRSRTANLGPLGNKPLDEVPYSVSVTPAALIENLQAGSLTEALRYDPTVNPEMGSNRSGDYLSIRGFINSSNQSIDGLRASVAAGGYLEDKEKVEVMSGATSFLSGIASPAGMVNYVLKRPTATPMHSLTVGDYGGAQGFVHLDAGGLLDEEGRFAYRLNVLGVDDGNTGIDHERRPRSLVSGAIDWHLSQDTLLSFDAAHYHYKLEYAQAYFFVNNITRIPTAPDASKNYSAPYSIMEGDYDTQGLMLTSKLNERVTLRSALRHGRIDLRYSGVRDRMVNNAGDYTQEMMYYRSPNVTTEERANVFLDVAFDTGALAHKVTVGYIGNQVEVSSAGTSTYNFPAATILSLGNPYYQPNPNVNTGNPAYTTQRMRQNNLLLADDIRLDDHWSVLAGATRADLNDRNYSSSNGSLTSAYDKQAVTPSLALTYKVRPGAMVYTSYIEALEEGATAPVTAANAGDVLKPYLSTQYELGSKLTLGEVDLKAALFRIEKDSAYTDPVTKIFSADGRQVHRGAEFSFTGKVSERLTLLGGFSVLDAKLTKTTNVALQGKTPQAVPEKLLRLYGEYALPSLPGLALTGGLSHTGAMWADDLNTLSYPGVTTGDIGMRYVSSLAGHRATWRVTVSNVTGKDYWTSKGGSMLYLGSPRTLAASASFEF
ncbi:MAG TPA: TonB-dependent receptor [Rhodocyclaceae bacterium]|jgi:iron complex outermembrane receptor protein|nr:TonB-dependent receptor [Rhodocyclaceae bacterium]